MLPIDRTWLTKAALNQVPEKEADPEANYKTLKGAYDYADQLNQQADNHAGADILPHKDRSVTRDKIALRAIGTNELDDNSVTPSKIPNGSISPSKLAADAIINETINNALITALKADIESHSDVSPDKFNGNDFEKLQQAINYAQENKVSIKLDRQYNITGLGKLLFNKPDGVVRVPLYFNGVNGGGITKNDPGLMFGANTDNNSDFYFDKIFFRSITGVGAIVYESPKLIRLTFNNCYFKDVDHLVKGGDNDFLQSLRMRGNSVIGGKGFFIDFPGGYDIQISNELVEQRESYFNHRDKGTHNRLYGLNFKVNTVEGLSGTAMVIGSCEATSIDDNYFEFNAKEIEFLPTASLFGLSMKGNRHGGVARTSPSFIKLGGSAYSVTLENNVSQNLPIVDTTAITSGEVLFLNNNTLFTSIPFIDPVKRLNRYNYNDYKIYTTGVDGFNGHVANKGLFKRLYGRVDSVHIVAEDYKEIQIQFAEDLHLDDVISIQMFTNFKKVFVANYYRDFTNKKMLRVYLKNLETTDVTINNIFVTCLQSSSITG